MTPSDRGENSFKRLPKFAAKMYEKMTNFPSIQLQHSQIADDLLKKIQEGKLLDVGTGHGILLKIIHQKNPRIELYGLDISEEMINRARDNLKEIDVHLSSGTIHKTTYSDNFFDLITCTGSFYIWNYPVESINEVFRILQPRRSAILYESYRDHDKQAFLEMLSKNLENISYFKKKISAHFLKRQLSMTYSVQEFEDLFTQTKFARNYTLEKVSRGNLPVWLKIELKKT